MKLYDLTELAVRNLRQSLLRNSLTTVGISVGVASLVSMLSLGIGLQQMASRRLVKAGLFDTVIVSSRREVRGFEREGDEGGPAPAQSPQLDEAARQTIAAMPTVREAYPDIRFVTELRFNGTPHLTTVAGLAESARDNDAFEGMQGRFFSSSSALEVIVQKSFAEELLGRTPKPGLDQTPVSELGPPLLGKPLVMRYAERVAAAPAATESAPKAGARTDPSPPSHPNSGEVAGEAYSVISREQTFKIVGVADLDPDSMRGQARARVFLPLALAQTLHVVQPADVRSVPTGSGAKDVPVYSTLQVRVKNASQVSVVEDAIKKLGFNTFSIVDATRSLQRFFAILDLFLGIFGSLALAVASIGIVNTLVMAILERRREIGILKALGASDSDVKALFFVEAGAMGVFGGVLGVALGWTIGRVINAGTNFYLQGQNIPPEQIWFVPWWLVLGAIVFAVVVSLLSGLYPASRAARLDPVQALRYE